MYLIKTLLTMLALACLSACGSGSGNGNGGGSQPPPPPPPPPPPTGGITRTGIAAGPISTFGSVVINGVHYDTGTATFTIDDSTGTEADLSVGEFIIVKGTINEDLTTGTAEEVIFDDNVEGTVENINTVLGQMVVLGQTVIVGPDTSFDDSIVPAALEGISQGDIIEVSGFVDANGSIIATHAEKKPSGSAFEVHGIVSNLDSVALTFSINNLVVDYSNATLDNFPGGQISNGDFIEAKGSTPNGNVLVAGSVELESTGIPGDDGDHVEIEGLITRFATATDFDVSGIPVITNAGTLFAGGLSTDLALNVKVEIEGDLDANGAIVAEKVDIRLGKVVKTTAIVDSVETATNTLVLLGINFTVDAVTRFQDKSAADVQPLTLADINAGDYLEIRGGELPAGSGQIQATFLERLDGNAPTILQGFVTNVADPNLTILGVTIETSGAIFRDIDNTILTATEFFNKVNVDSLVKTRGTESSATTITATQVELELEL